MKRCHAICGKETKIDRKMVMLVALPLQLCSIGTDTNIIRIQMFVMTDSNKHDVSHD